jgi:hypothetical protein
LSALTDDQKSAYIDALRSGQRRLMAARACEVDPLEILAASQNDAEFAKAIVMAEMEADDEVEDALRMAAISGNVTAAMKWLVNRRPDRWSDGKPVQTVPGDMAQSASSGSEIVAQQSDRMLDIRRRAQIRVSHRQSTTSA